MINSYLLVAGIIIIGYIIAKFAILRIIKAEEELGPENIQVEVCPICGSLDTTTTAEDTALGLNFKCKNCKYVGTMLEMNLVQATEYTKRRKSKK